MIATRCFLPLITFFCIQAFALPTGGNRLTSDPETAGSFVKITQVLVRVGQTETGARGVHEKNQMLGAVEYSTGDDDDDDDDDDDFNCGCYNNGKCDDSNPSDTSYPCSCPFGYTGPRCKEQVTTDQVAPNVQDTVNQTESPCLTNCSVMTTSPSVTNTSLGLTSVTNTSLGPTSVTNTSLGPTSVTNTSPGPKTVTNTSLGSTSVINSTLGPTTVTNTSLGPTSVINNTLGPTSVINSTLGPTSVTNTSLGSTTIKNCSLVGTASMEAAREDGSCVCRDGWTGRDCTEDVDECSLGTVACPGMSECRNVPGSFRCECLVGYRWEPEKRICLELATVYLQTRLNFSVQGLNLMDRNSSRYRELVGQLEREMSSKLSLVLGVEVKVTVVGLRSGSLVVQSVVEVPIQAATDPETVLARGALLIMDGYGFRLDNRSVSVTDVELAHFKFSHSDSQCARKQQLDPCQEHTQCQEVVDGQAVCRLVKQEKTASPDLAIEVALGVCLVVSLCVLVACAAIKFRRGGRATENSIALNRLAGGSENHNDGAIERTTVTISEDSDSDITTTNQHTNLTTSELDNMTISQQDNVTTSQRNNQSEGASGFSTLSGRL